LSAKTVWIAPNEDLAAAAAAAEAEVAEADVEEAEACEQNPPLPLKMAANVARVAEEAVAVVAVAIRLAGLVRRVANSASANTTGIQAVVDP